MNNQIDETYVETNQIRLHTVQAGPPGGPLVILLHGFPEFWYGWNKQIRPLAEAGFRVLAPDLRGYNLSDKPQDISAYRLDHLVDDVTGLIEAAGREKAVLVGHDWGALVAWVAAVLRPERLEKMAILNGPYPLAGIQAALRDPTQLLRSSYVLFFQLPLFPEAILRNNNWEMLVKGMRRSSRPRTFSEEDFRQYRQARRKKDAMTSMLNYYRAFLRRPLSLPRKPRISVPTLILWGVQDAALSQATAEMSVDLCEHGELVYFEDAGHWIQHEEAHRVNELLLEFLRDSSGEASSRPQQAHSV